VRENKVDSALRQYVDTRFEAQEKAVSAALAAQEKAVAAALAAAKEAVIKAENATERRFENSNEWRNTVEALQRTYMPRTESEQHWKTVDEKVDVLTTRMNAIDQRGRGRGDVWAYVVGAIGILAALVSIALAVTRPLLTGP
jgi:hypothetical protein